MQESKQAESLASNTKTATEIQALEEVEPITDAKALTDIHALEEVRATSDAEHSPEGIQSVSSEDLQENSSSEEEPVAAWAFQATDMPPWQKIEDGLDIGLFPAIDSLGAAVHIIMLRVSPSQFGFAVYATSASKAQAMSLGDWAAQKNLLIAINASMYLPDGITSTGYLRVHDHLNNAHIAKNFGAFFVAEPKNSEINDSQSTNEASPKTLPKTLPEAQLLDRQFDDWETIINQYEMVVQNYRMTSADGRLLWQKGGPRHAISALGRATDGSLLFIHCRDPILGVDFASLMLSLPYEIGPVMYLEGGAQAGLMLRSPNMNAVWLGRDYLEFWAQNNSIAQLPNVIGVYRKNSFQQ